MRCAQEGFGSTRSVERSVRRSVQIEISVGRSIAVPIVWQILRFI